MTTHHDLANLITDGFLPHRSILLWQPTMPVDDVSNPDNLNRDVRTSLLCHGFSLPLHSFLWVVLCPEPSEGDYQSGIDTF